jgi:hypothetical protein
LCACPNGHARRHNTARRAQHARAHTHTHTNQQGNGQRDRKKVPSLGESVVQGVTEVGGASDSQVCPSSCACSSRRADASSLLANAMTPKRLPHFFIQEVSFVHGVQTCLPTKVADRLVAFLPPTIFSGSNVELSYHHTQVPKLDIRSRKDGWW